MVNLDYSFSISSILVFKVVNFFFILFWQLQIVVIISASLVFLDIPDLLKFDLLASIFLSLFLLVFFLCNVIIVYLSLSIWSIAYFPQYCLLYLGSSLLTAPPFRWNEVLSEAFCWLTLDLVNLSRIMMVACMFLGQRSSPVVKFYCKYNFNFYVDFHFSGEKYTRGTFTLFTLLLPVVHLD